MCFPREFYLARQKKLFEIAHLKIAYLMLVHSSKTSVFFNGECPLCSTEIGIYRKSDMRQNIVFIDVNNLNKRLPPGLTRTKAKARFHVTSPDGYLLSGAEAFIEVWRQLPKWRWLAACTAHQPIPQIIELTFRFFIIFRPTFVKLYLFPRRASTRE